MQIKTKDGRKFEFNPKYDGWIPHQYEEMKQYDSFYGFDKNWVVVDVGAWIGLWVVWVAPKVRGVFALEPIHYDNLIQNVKLNNLRNVGVTKEALYSSIGTETMDITSLPSASTLIKDAWKGAKYLYKGAKKKKVKTYTWDYFTRQYNINTVNLLKMDVEGAELAVLSQMTVILPERITIAIYHHPAPFHKIHCTLHKKGYALDGMGYYDKHAKNGGEPHSAFFRRKDIPFKTPQRYEMGEWEKPSKKLLEGGIPYYPQI